MALKLYKNPKTGEEKESLKDLTKQGWEEVLQAPNTKFMESSNPYTGKSRLKDMDKILTARSRNHSRDTQIDELIQLNSNRGMEETVSKNFLNEKGERRRKIDDI